MRPNERRVLEICIEAGLKRGLRLATKHDDSPKPETVADRVAECIEDEICEWFEFDKAASAEF